MPPTAPSHPSAAIRGPHRVHVILWALWLLAVLSGCASLPDPVERPVSHALAQPERTRLGREVARQRALVGTAQDSGFRLLGRTEAAYASRLAMVDAAEQTLDLQYYAILVDQSTEQLVARLRAAAARGVRVRILLDDFNTVGVNAQLLQLAFEPNIALRLYNPLPGSRRSLFGRLLGSLGDFDRVQRRMHNKMFIADNVLGITGGRNLGDAYFGQGTESNFIDLDVLAAGRIVQRMSASFDAYWNNPLAYPVPALLSPDEIAALRPRNGGVLAAPAASTALAASTPAPAPAPATGQAPAPAPTPATAQVPAAASMPTSMSMSASVPVLAATSASASASGPASAPPASAPAPLDLSPARLTWAPSLLLVDKPDKLVSEEKGDDDTVVDGLLRLMERARHDVLIVSPYFVPGEEMMDVFERLRGRGVQVRVLTNSLASNDAPLAHVGYARYRERLLAMGVQIYEMRAERSASGGVMTAGSASALRVARHGSESTPQQPARIAGSTLASRASLHAKTLVLDDDLLVVGSMNLDLRSQLQNSELALLIRNRHLAQQAASMAALVMENNAYRVQLQDGALAWRAPDGDVHRAPGEPDAGAGLQFMLKLLGPLAPDEML